ncbi:hypothetical protein BRADI_2g36612v3 [Brachypodium distachyon]|uniref:Uncharacterized protein n=1 Tax=Brachypodium distachyon TaxID=15368 RepID=A0A0Q3IP37_BRADI|nr:hypothetical protein BRADI_2g36612v3 [Brachypodium distachyon]
MFGWGKRGKNPAPASGGSGEVAVQKVDRIEFHNIIKPPPRFGGGTVAANPRNPAPLPPAVNGTAPRMPDGSPRDDINRKASRFIEDTKKRWQLAHKSFRATGTGR